MLSWSCGLICLHLLRFDDATYPGSSSGNATAGCNLQVERPAGVIKCPDGDRRVWSLSFDR